MKAYLLAILFLMPFLSFSQNFDKIKTKANKTIDCTITEINKNFILYRIELFFTE